MTGKTKLITIISAIIAIIAIIISIIVFMPHGEEPAELPQNTAQPADAGRNLNNVSPKIDPELAAVEDADEESAPAEINREALSEEGQELLEEYEEYENRVVFEDDGEMQDPYSTGPHEVKMTIEGYEPIAIELDADAAPITVSNFMHLVDRKYYNGLSFYRFHDGFCMQGGTIGNDPYGDDPNIEPIVGEFEENNRDNSMAEDFKRGTVAMARTADPNSAKTTFFITLDKTDVISASMDSQYAAFGQIDESGMQIIDKVMADRQHLGKRDGGLVDRSGFAKIISIDIVY